MSLLSRPSSRRGLSGARVGAYRPHLAREEHDRTRTWRAIWSTTAEGCGLAPTVQVPAGTTAVVPPLLAVLDVAGRPLELVVEMLRGQHAPDYVAVTDRLAVALDAAVVVVTCRGGRTLGLELHDTDPLDEPFPLTPAAVASVGEPLVLGRGEDHATLGHPLAAPAHIAVQGQNGSGKSVFCYGLLAQVVHAPDVLVAGSDITGLLLGRPWDGTRHRAHQAVGTADLEAHAVLLEDLVAEMDARLADMPVGVDKLEPTVRVPLMLVVLEEFPGLLRAAANVAAPGKVNGKAPPTVLARIRLAVLRLLSEGRKAAFRVLMLAQRAEAETMGGGYARDQFALAVSFRVPADSLAMLHGDGARELGPRHQTAPPGVAVVSAPGRPLARMRAPYVGTYAEFCARVGGAR